MNENATCYEGTLQCTSTSSVKLQTALKIVSTLVFLAQGDDELIGVLSLELVHELDNVAVTVLVKGLGVHVCQLILALGVVDADLALLQQFLREKIP